MQDGPDPLVIYPSRWKVAAVFVGSLTFVIVGATFAWYRAEIGLDWVTVVVGSYVGVPFFSACAVYALYRLIVRRPAVVVHPEGLWDDASALGVGFLAWDAIDAIAPREFAGQWSLGIYPTDLDAVLARQGQLKRWLLRLNGSWGGAPINIPQAVLPMRVDELAARIVRDYAPEFGAAARLDCFAKRASEMPSKAKDEGP